MIWVDREVKKIKDKWARPERAKRVEWVDDMKTPSGRIHVGSLRGVVIHDLVYKVLVENKINTQFSYVFNDMDQMDGMPAYLEKEKWEQYMGMPLNKIPSPVDGYKNFAEYYAKEYQEVFESINCRPQIIWSSALYQSGKMNDVIKTVLDNAQKIREIYYRVSKATKPDNWYPFSAICEKCGKIGTTNVYQWDGEYVYYRCEPDMVEWAKGCGHQGKITPYDGHGKLPWRIDWPAHWKVIGVTIESSGKDHMSAGGSYDMASHVCRGIFATEPPLSLGGYEWFTIGGKKMSSSKGVGSSAKEVSQILPPDVFRFLIVRTPINTHLDFNPYGETILNLFDDFDRCLNAYFTKLENKIPAGKPGEVLTDFARIFELSAVKPLYKKRLFIPRFRTIVNLLKSKVDVLNSFEKQKGASLTDKEKEILEERIKYAKIYSENYSGEQFQEKQSFSLSPEQKKFLEILKGHLNDLKTNDRDSIQESVFASLKKSGLKPKTAFQAFYRALTGKDFGPKAADLILEMGIEKIIDKLSQ